MTKKWLWVWLIAFLLIFQNNHAEEAIVAAQSNPASEILRLVNQVRAGYGLPPFTWDGSLAAAAQNQASFMATSNVYSHTGAGGSSPQSRAQAAGYPGHATENIVGGTDLTPNQGVIWWQNSPIHFNTMISQQYIHAGVGFAQGHDQNFYALVVGVPADQANSAALNVPVPGDDTLAPVVPVQIAEPGEDGGIVHVVGSGQSFWAIAARYEIPLEQLYLFNNLTEESVINPGDKLIIRLADGQEPPPTPTPPASHIVQQGESLWTIAAWYKLSLEQLLWLNSLEEDSLVQPGDEVKIRLLPGESPPPTATVQTIHVVQAGDTAWGISELYGLAVDQLLAFNSLTASSVLSIGDQLLIVAPSPTPTETPLPSDTPPPLATPTPVVTVTIVGEINQQQMIQVEPLETMPTADPLQTATTSPALGTGSIVTMVGGLFLVLVLISFVVFRR